MDSVEEKSNQARGYKATLSNPRVSDEAKENAKAELERMEGEPSIAEAAGETDKDPGNVARGLKAATNNPNVTEEGKKAAQEKLEKMGAA